MVVVEEREVVVEEATGWGRAVGGGAPRRGGRSGGEGSSTCVAGAPSVGSHGLPVVAGQGAAAGGGRPLVA